MNASKINAGAWSNYNSTSEITRIGKKINPTDRFSYNDAIAVFNRFTGISGMFWSAGELELHFKMRNSLKERNQDLDNFENTGKDLWRISLKKRISRTYYMKPSKYFNFELKKLETLIAEDSIIK